MSQNSAIGPMRKAEIGLAAARKDFELQSAGAGLDARNKQLLAERQRAVVAEQRRQVDALTLRAPFDGLLAIRRAVRRLEKLGYEVTLTPKDPAA